MQEADNELLARTGFARDEHRAVRGGDLLHDAEDAPESGSPADDLFACALHASLATRLAGLHAGVDEERRTVGARQYGVFKRCSYSTSAALATPAACGSRFAA